MDLSALGAISSVTSTGTTAATGSLTDMSLLTDSISGGTTEKTDGTLFESFLNTAISNIDVTNSYLSDYENEEIKWALGETENTHDLTIALQKASTALQYTVAIRDRVLDAYKEIMNIQI